MTGRATTPEAKREVVERLLAIWLSRPEQRLGQLIENARGWYSRDLFYIEDSDLLRTLYEYHAALVNPAKVQSE